MSDDDRIPVGGSATIRVAPMWPFQTELLEFLRPHVVGTSFTYNEVRCRGKCGKVLAHQVHLLLDDETIIDAVWIHQPAPPGSLRVELESGGVLEDATFRGATNGAPGAKSDRGVLPLIAILGQPGTYDTPIPVECGSHGPRGTITGGQLRNGSVRL